MHKQVCIIPLLWDYLLQYTNLKPTPLEQAESVDVMRVLKYGEKIRMVTTKHQTYAVDTPEDLIHVEKIMMEQSHNA